MINPSRLVQELNNTGLQNKDTPLYQLLLNLIRLTLSITNSINAGATNINPSAIETIIIQQAMQGIDGLNGEDGMSIVGAKGDTGSTGSIGLTGAIGARGFDGIDGEDGLSIPGPKGDIGATGASGTSTGSVSSDNDGYDNDLMSYPNSIGPFKRGSVLFYDGKINEDNSGLFWDNDNDRLGVGTAAPGSGTDGGGVAYSAYGTTKIHINGGMFLIVPSSAGAAQGAMFDAQNLASGSNMFLFNAPTGWTGNYFSANLNGVQKFFITEAGNASYAGTLNVTGISTFGAPIKLKGYTVATLPAGVVGYVAYCTDLLAPAFLAIAVGGGAVVGIVFYNGSNWVTV